MKLRNLRMNESVEKQFSKSLENEHTVLEPTEATAIEVEKSIKKEMEDDFKEQDKVADEVAKDTNATEVNEPKKVKDRKELGKLLSEAKEAGQKVKISRCNEEGFRYLVEWVESEETKETLEEEKHVCPECGKEVCECNKQVKEKLEDEDDIFDLNSELYHALKDVVKQFLDKGIDSDDLESAFEFCILHAEDDEEFPDEFFKNPTWGKKEEPKEDSEKDLDELFDVSVTGASIPVTANDNNVAVGGQAGPIGGAFDEDLDKNFKSAGQIMNENPEWQSASEPNQMRQLILKVLDDHKEEMEPKNYNYARMTFEKANRNAIFGLVAAFTTGDAINPNKEHKQNVKDLESESLEEKKLNESKKPWSFAVEGCYDEDDESAWETFEFFNTENQAKKFVDKGGNGEYYKYRVTVICDEEWDEDQLSDELGYSNYEIIYEPDKIWEINESLETSQEKESIKIEDGEKPFEEEKIEYEIDDDFDW